MLAKMEYIIHWVPSVCPCSYCFINIHAFSCPCCECHTHNEQNYLSFIRELSDFLTGTSRIELANLGRDRNCCILLFCYFFLFHLKNSMCFTLSLVAVVKAAHLLSFRIGKCTHFFICSFSLMVPVLL